ncbi:MAG: hypothetical protein JJE55_00595 [Flavobacteriaceae bacterium]|nr:hypothetical protein [Flavobacteriaceae bacterium]
MKYLLLVVLLSFFSCKKSGEAHKLGTDINNAEPSIYKYEKPELPEGALRADFIGNQDSVYAFIKEIDASTETTLIGFENKKLPEITIPESVGAELHILKLKNFVNDVLLVNAKLKDTNFNEYYLFVWEDSIWKQPANRFDIHKSNMTDTLIPIKNNPKDSTQLLRYYSVFDMDRTSGKKYSWKLMQESIPIEE